MKESWRNYSGSIEKSREYHKRYQIAVNNPVRKRILKMLNEGKNMEEIKKELGLSEKDFEFHLQILEWGFCIVRNCNNVQLTKEGKVVEHLD